MTTKPEATKTPDDVMNELKVPKQGELDGMESASIKELDTLKMREDSVKVAVAEGVAVEADEGDDEGGEEPLQ